MESVTPADQADRIPIGNLYRDVKAGKGEPPRWRWFLVGRDKRVHATCKIRGFRTKQEAAEAFDLVRQEMSTPLREKFERAMRANTVAVEEAQEAVKRIARDRDATAAKASRKVKLLWGAVVLLIITVVALATSMAGA